MSTFDGIEALNDDTQPRFNPGQFPRKLTTATLNTLRLRRTGAGRAVRRPLRRQGRQDGDGSDDDEDDSDSDTDDDDITCGEVLCCCWGPRCCVAGCMLITALMGWSAAITYGIARAPTYEQLAMPIRVARQKWLSKTPQNAEEGFILFDRNADGLIGVDDMAQVARITTGEDPTHQELVDYIARGDLDGDGALNEAEYTALLHRERAEGRPSGRGKGKGRGGQ